MIGGQADVFKASIAASRPLARRSVHFRLRGGDDGGFRVFEADAVHRFAEQLAVFGHFDGIARGADHFDAELFEDAHFFER